MPLPIYKYIGETPLEVIQRLKQAQPELADETISYAGRLDPMAEGVLLLLIGDENKQRKDLENLDKTYIFDVLFGVQTDSYDSLGLITQTKPVLEDLKERLEDYRASHIGTVSQTYPPYSSKPVHGKPLYWWARHGKLSELELPTKEIQIYSFTFSPIRNVSKQILREAIISRIKTVSGDFRQEEILRGWEEFFAATSLLHFQLLTCEVTCSSGTYIRSLVHDMGKTLGCGALAYSIKRTRIGKYNLEE